MSNLTITQGLREIKTLHDRISKKRQFVNEHLVRQADRRDPLENDGGQAAVIAREIQAVGDMELRVLTLRRAIAVANLQTPVTVGDRTMAISDWIIWKREIAPREREHQQAMAQQFNAAMLNARRAGVPVVQRGEPPATNLDVIFNFSVAALQEASDKLTRDLGELDGLLSMANATTLIDVESPTVS
jgi:hypothetical protein